LRRRCRWCCRRSRCCHPCSWSRRSRPCRHHQPTRHWRPCPRRPGPQPRPSPPLGTSWCLANSPEGRPARMNKWKRRRRGTSRQGSECPYGQLPGRRGSCHADHGTRQGRRPSERWRDARQARCHEMSTTRPGTDAQKRRFLAGGQMWSLSPCWAARITTLGGRRQVVGPPGFPTPSLARHHATRDTAGPLALARLRRHRDGTRMLALLCSTCQNPAPVVLTILEPDAGDR
jgi:hypothetical protein